MHELYAYVWRSSASQQIFLILLAIIAAVLATAPLELQRRPSSAGSIVSSNLGVR
jgi:hypothetical protein